MASNPTVVAVLLLSLFLHRTLSLAHGPLRVLQQSLQCRREDTGEGVLLVYLGYETGL